MLTNFKNSFTEVARSIIFIL